MTLAGTTSDASGIDGLVVDGVTYDVRFYNSSYDSIYSSTAPTFLGKSGGAADAASALASALSSFDVTELVGIGPQYVMDQRRLCLWLCRREAPEILLSCPPPAPEISLGLFPRRVCNSGVT
jgi:hypothetical protein